MTLKMRVVQNIARNLQSTLGQGARNVLVPGLPCQPCAGKSCIGPECGRVSALFSIYGSELQSGLERSVHPPPGRALTHQAADSRFKGSGGAMLQFSPFALTFLDEQSHSLPQPSKYPEVRGMPSNSPTLI